MQNIHFDSLSNIRKGRYDWTIKVRLIRKWRNTTTEGKLVKGFNALLLDDKNVTMQSFVGDPAYLKFIDIFNIGSIYVISNFSVKDVGMRDKNLLTQTERQIYFSSYTTVEAADDIHSLIPNNAFDFYDIADLEDMLKQDRYLTDVIGVIQDYQPIRRWISKVDNETHKAIVKFNITDGSSHIKTTFWDDYAEEFQKSINEAIEEPYIVIVAGAKIIMRDVLEIATARPTTHYINYHHHSVQQLRKMIITTPSLTQPPTPTQRNNTFTALTIDQLKQLGKDDIGKKVMLMLTIRKMESAFNWFFYECTSCMEEVFPLNGVFRCNVCDRKIPYPDRKFQVNTLCSDSTGTIAVILNDREVRRLTMRTVFNLTSEDSVVNNITEYPAEIQNLLNVEVRALIHLTPENTNEGCNVFTAAEVALGHYNSDMSINTPNAHSFISEIYSQQKEETSSTSDLHLDDISQLHLQTPDVSTKAKKNYKNKGVIKMTSM